MPKRLGSFLHFRSVTSSTLSFDPKTVIKWSLFSTIHIYIIYSKKRSADVYDSSGNCFFNVPSSRPLRFRKLNNVYMQQYTTLSSLVLSQMNGFIDLSRTRYHIQSIGGYTGQLKDEFNDIIFKVVLRSITHGTVKFAVLKWNYITNLYTFQ
jgi:hypothetical protein